MIFGLVTLAEFKLHPPSFIIMSATHWALTCLIVVGELGKLRGDNLGKLGGAMWLWGVHQLVLWIFCSKKPVRQHFILPVATLETDTTNSGIPVGFHWQMTHHVELLVMSSTHTTLNNGRVPHVIVDWETINLRFQSLDQHLFTQLRFQRFQILWSRFAIANSLKLLVLESISWMIPRGWRRPH